MIHWYYDNSGAYQTAGDADLVQWVFNLEPHDNSIFGPGTPYESGARKFDEHPLPMWWILAPYFIGSP